MDEHLDYFTQRGTVRRITISSKGSVHHWRVTCSRCKKTHDHKIEKERWMFLSFKRRTHLENQMMGHPCLSCKAC